MSSSITSVAQRQQTREPPQQQQRQQQQQQRLPPPQPQHQEAMNLECTLENSKKSAQKKKKRLEESSENQQEGIRNGIVVACAEDKSAEEVTKPASPGAAAAAAAPSSSNSNTKKSRKRDSPFRIKTGCIVALRPDSAGNHVTVVSETNGAAGNETVRPTLFGPADSSGISAWVNPVAGRDQGLALIGKRIRCHFPKRLLGQDESSQKRRVLEGEVVRLVDYTKRKPGKPWKIELLIHKRQFQHFQHLLIRVDEDVDESTLPNDKARRNYRNEVRIRGPDKVVVKMRLLHPGTSLEQQTSNCVQWVIQKRVPSKLFHAESKTTIHKSTAAAALASNNKEGGNANGGDTKKTKSKSTDIQRKSPKRTPSSVASSPAQQVRHVGDGNDSPEQQVLNWRWLVSHYHELQEGEEHLEYAPGLIGQVMKMESSSDDSTLAFVTLRRMFLPEYTNTGRLSYHGKLEIFEQETSSTPQQFIVPVEELIVLGASVQRGDRNACDLDSNNVEFIASFSYSTQTGIYQPLSDCGGCEHSEDSTQTGIYQPLSDCGGCEHSDDALSSPRDSAELTPCHRCRRMTPQSQLQFCRNMSCEMYTDAKPGWCSVCTKPCLGEHNEHDDDNLYLPCCFGLCDCQNCRSQLAMDSEEFVHARVRKKMKKRSTNQHEENRFFGMASGVAQACRWVHFALDAHAFLDVSKLPVPATTASKRNKVKGKSLKRLVRKQDKGVNNATKGDATNQQSTDDAAATTAEKEDFSVFKPTCARQETYDAQKRMKRPIGWYETFQSTADVPRNLREVQPKSLLTETDPDDKTNVSRATRAKQRRIVKGVANCSGLGFDMLASRESQLRFGRSVIHAWGVFAEQDIQNGDLIIEYRGEIIGNARAEKREKEYELAKLGSDYMFRIDKDTVCDATKLGNVARFFNASCEPNCYAKIISVEGNKRIVIYAKKDIPEGEELCYDYKFPLEYDPKKRIPCHCGTQNCRGFMNWDKRYVEFPPPEEEEQKERNAGESNLGPGRLKNAGEQL